MNGRVQGSDVLHTVEAVAGKVMEGRGGRADGTGEIVGEGGIFLVPWEDVNSLRL